MHLYWSVIALAVAILLVGPVGRLARYYLGKKLIQLVDVLFLRVPLLNKIYSALKQINDAFTSNRAATCKQVVLVEFPRAGLYSIGFITGTQNSEVQAKTRQTLVSVFVPTPPLTSGSIVLVPAAEVAKLDMSGADGVKFTMSLGSFSPTSCMMTEPKNAEEHAPPNRRGSSQHEIERAVAPLNDWFAQNRAPLIDGQQTVLGSSSRFALEYMHSQGAVPYWRKR